MKKYIVNINSSYTRDCQVLHIPKELSESDEEEFVTNLNEGVIEYKNEFFGWLDCKNTEIFLGVVNAENEQDAKSKYNAYSPRQLEVYEVY